MTKHEYANGKTLMVWRWDEAPNALRWLSMNGGDEDLIIAEPKTDEWRDNSAEDMARRLAVCDYDEYEAEIDGVVSRVFITCHA